jgi:YVTN family beta-propeller protein
VPPGKSTKHTRSTPWSCGCFALSLVALLGVTSGCKKHDFPAYADNYREYAYVSNGGDGTVTVLDLTSLRQDRVVTVGKNPTGLAVNPTRNEVYAVNSGSNSVSVLDTVHNDVVATIPVRKQPYFLSVDAAGERGYVANTGSNDVSVIDFAQRRQIGVIGVGEKPGMAVISPDGNTLVVSNLGSNSISIADPHTMRVRSVFPGCPGATDVTVSLDSAKAFIACSAGHQVMVLGLAQVSGSAAAPMTDAAKSDRLLTMLDVGKSPVDIALKPDGGEAFTSNFDGDSVSEIATTANEVGGTYGMGAGPVRGIVSADNTLLWDANFRAGTVSIYSIDDGKLVGAVHVGDGPDAMAFSKEGHLLFVVDAKSGDVAVIRTMTRSLFTLLPCGTKPNDIVVKAFRLK